MKRSYDAWRQEQGSPEPFIIGGQEFTPRLKLPWEKFGKLIMSMDEDDADEFQKLRDFFSLVLRRADRQRFLDLLAADGEDDDDDCIDSLQVQELTKDLMALYTGKAPASGGSSEAGPSTTGQPSNAGSSNVVSLTPHAVAG